MNNLPELAPGITYVFVCMARTVGSGEHPRVRRMILSVALVTCGLVPAYAEDYVADAYPIRNHNPFLQIFGLPAFQTGELVAPGRLDFGVSYDIANDADDADRLNERLVIDAESQILGVSLRRRVGERFELGIDLPYVRHSEGFLDSLIYDFHKLVGLPNSNRDGPVDRYQLFFEKQGAVLFDTNAPTSGLGDVQLSAAMQLGKVTLRAGVKAPTGDPDKLTGSGATDVSLGVYSGGATSFLDRELSFTGFAGVLALGEGEVLADLQRSAVPYGGAALRWQATNRLAFATQLYVQGPYFDANLDELGGTTFQLAFGTDVHLERSILRFAIIEDIAAGAAPDFALHLSFRRFGR